MRHLAAGQAHPGAAGTRANDQRGTQRGAQIVAQRFHLIVERAAHGYRHFVERRTQPVGQLDRGLAVAGPDRARQHQILKQPVVDPFQRTGRAEHDLVRAGIRVAAGLADERVNACCRRIH